MKKGRKISWAATTQGIGRRGIPKSAHVYSNHYFSAKKKKTLLPPFLGRPPKIFMPGSDLLSLSLAMTSGHRHTTATDASSFLCRLSGFLICFVEVF